MNTDYLRRALKTTWLQYYRDNRPWIVRLGVWVNCDGQRRPSSSFILGTLATIEPQLLQLLPLIVDLSSNPDRIVMALGLNFSPDDELESFEKTNGSPPVKMLPGGDEAVQIDQMEGSDQRDRPSKRDEDCQGIRNADALRRRD